MCFHNCLRFSKFNNSCILFGYNSSIVRTVYNVSNIHFQKILFSFIFEIIIIQNIHVIIKKEEKNHTFYQFYFFN